MRAEYYCWTAAKCSNERVKHTGAEAHGKREPRLKLCWEQSAKIAISVACFVSPGVSTETLYNVISSSSCCLVFSRDYHHFPSTSTTFLRKWKDLQSLLAKPKLCIRLWAQLRTRQVCPLVPHVSCMVGQGYMNQTRTAIFSELATVTYNIESKEMKTLEE